MKWGFSKIRIEEARSCNNEHSLNSFYNLLAMTNPEFKRLCGFDVL